MIELEKFLVIVDVWGHINHCLISLTIYICLFFSSFFPSFMLFFISERISGWKGKHSRRKKSGRQRLRKELSGDFPCYKTVGPEARHLRAGEQELQKFFLCVAVCGREEELKQGMIQRGSLLRQLSERMEARRKDGKKSVREICLFYLAQTAA